MNHETTAPRLLLKIACLPALLQALAGQGLAKEPVASGGFLAQQTDVAACKANLNRIFEALQEYQRAHTNLPNYFSDLHPEFIVEPRLFICPTALRTGNYLSGRGGLRNDLFEDVLPTTYSYEFSIKPYPLWCGIASTHREFKLRQMKLLGSDVPVVRCFLHRICLSVGGVIFDSPTRDWEECFTDRVPVDQLFPPAIFKDRAPVPGQPAFPILPRGFDADPRLIDLGDFYVASLDKPWVWSNDPKRSVSAIPRGIVKFDSVPVLFDIRGLIQLDGKGVFVPFPGRVDGVPIHQCCRRIHFLEGTISPTSTGTEIGHYEIHYADGDRKTVPIVYGRDVFTTWSQRPATNSLPSRLAWESERRDEGGVSLSARLYRQVWANPRPEATIDAIDFVSAMTTSAPFLIAITLEP